MLVNKRRKALTVLTATIAITAGFTVAASSPALAGSQRSATVIRPASAPPASSGEIHSYAPAVRTERINLSPAQCAGLRSSLHNAKAPCTGAESLRTSVIRTTASGSTYLDGWLEACQAFLSNGYCDQASGYWYVYDPFNFTVNPSTDQVWNNGPGNCYGGGTDIDWCSWAGRNGSSTISEGFNFNHSKDYARINLYANETFSTAPSNSWEHICGGVLPSNDGFGCTG